MEDLRDEGAGQTQGYGRRLASGSLINFVAILVVFISGFVLTPFLLDRLGPLQYGLFVLAQSVVGFFPLLNLGVPASLSRFLSRDLTRGDPEALNRSFSAGLVFLLLAGAAASVLGLLGVLLLPHILGIEPESARLARLVFALLVIETAVSLPLLAYRTVYQAAQRFTTPSWVQIVVVPVRTAVIFLLFLSGHAHLLVWAGVRVISEILGGAYLALRAKRVVPGLRARLTSVSRREVRGLIGFSSWVFLGSVGYLLYHNTDYLLIQWFVSPSEVAHYNLAARWDPILRTLVGTIANPIAPIAAALWESRKEEELRQLLLRTSRYVMALALPSCLLLSIFSEPFLVAWAGPDYGRNWTVLVILMIPLIFSLAHGPAFSVYVGLGRTKVNGILTITLAVVNVGLSLFFVRVLGWGLEGIALGTALTYFVRTGILSPWYICRLTALPLRRYVVQVLLRPMLAAVPMVLLAFLFRLGWEFGSLPRVGIAMAVSSLGFAIPAWWLLFTRDERAQIRGWLGRGAK